MTNQESITKIIEKIIGYEKIVIMRHVRPDGDAIGSTQALRKMLKSAFPLKDIRLINEDFSDYLNFLGDEDEQMPDEYYQNALGIVVDTADKARVSNSKLELCKEIIKIDHHIDIAPFGDFSWIVDSASSACELIAEMYTSRTDLFPADKSIALSLYTGMVTDSGRFRFSSVSGDTMRLAGKLLDIGIDTEKLYAKLYLEDIKVYKFKAYVYNHIKTTRNGVAYIYVDKKMQERFKLTREEASNVISCLAELRGSIIWLAFIDNVDSEDKSIRVRLRSRFTTINELANKYHGGGHDRASGATVYSRREMAALVRDADKQLKKFKKEHEDVI